MSKILRVTTTEAVRAEWGVSEKDLSEETILALELPFVLGIDLESKGIDQEAVAETFAGIPSLAEKIQWLHLKEYSKFFCAQRISAAIRLAALQEISDGNLKGKRFSGPILDETTRGINAKFLRAATDLAETFSLTSVVVAALAVAATPSSDPVAGT